jgi:hypothetical protein
MSYYYPPPRRPQLKPVDKALTWLLCAVLVMVAGIGFLWSLFGMMATDRCSGYPCSDGLIGAAYVVAWGGIALAFALTLLGIRAAMARGWIAFIWPAVGLVLTVLALVSGAVMLNTAVGF